MIRNNLTRFTIVVRWSFGRCIKPTRRPPAISSRSSRRMRASFGRHHDFQHRVHRAGTGKDRAGQGLFQSATGRRHKRSRAVASPTTPKSGPPHGVYPEPAATRSCGQDPARPRFCGGGTSFTVEMDLTQLTDTNEGCGRCPSHRSHSQTWIVSAWPNRSFNPPETIGLRFSFPACPRMTGSARSRISEESVLGIPAGA